MLIKSDILSIEIKFIPTETNEELFHRQKQNELHETQNTSDPNHSQMGSVANHPFISSHVCALSVRSRIRYLQNR